LGNNLLQTQLSIERIAVNYRNLLLVTVACCGVLVGCSKTRPSGQTTGESVPNVVTADIQEGIEKHIEAQMQLGEGYFRLPYKDGELRLKLVRVHTEYLANLGPRRHFACVDMASTDGEVYDVDFFLTGDPGDMTVTETTVHKINGQPKYVWKQKRDKSWQRAAVKNAPRRLLGVIADRDEFEFLYQATLPEMTEKARMWIPMPSTDSFQTIEVTSITAPGNRKILQDQKFGNKVLFLELAPEDSGKSIAIRYQVQRLEKTVYPAKSPTPEDYLEPEQLVPANEEFSTIAAEVVKGKKGNLVRARAIYDHVIDRMRYIKYGDGWGKGDAVYACDARTGNCTDFHSYFIALARASDIPARFAIGAAIPSARNEGGIDGYHCWAEFYTDGNWWPIDISEGDKCSSLGTYYFGRNPANRVEFSRGRDLVVEPGPVSGPINFLAYPVLEVGGQPTKAKVMFSFTRSDTH